MTWKEKVRRRNKKTRDRYLGRRKFWKEKETRARFKRKGNWKSKVRTRE